MQLFRENRRVIEIGLEKSRRMDAEFEKQTVIDPRSRYLPLDDCDLDFY